MTRSRLLKGVAHNIMDHAVSGLGHLTEHVFDYCAHSRQRHLRLDLLRPDLMSSLDNVPTPLRLSAADKHTRFLSILSSAGFNLSELSSAFLQFEVLGDPKDKWPRFTCECVVETTAGKGFTATMDSKTYWKQARPEDPFEFLKRIRKGG